MSIFTAPKIDCHNHVVDPVRFPYAVDTPYRPAGQEVAPVEQLLRVFGVFNVAHALIVGTNSGYGSDSSCLLNALEVGQGRFKGVAVVKNDVDIEELRRLKALGIVGVAFNATFHGAEYYLGTQGLIEKLAELDLLLQLQVEGDQLLDLLSLVKRSPVQLLIDHCGRPVAEQGVAQPGFQTLLNLGLAGNAAVKISGLYKFSRESYPHRDAWPFVEALVDAFGIQNCVWGSDWPFLRATQRLDYGPLLSLVEMLFPDPAAQRALLWETPNRLFKFNDKKTF